MAPFGLRAALWGNFTDGIESTNASEYDDSAGRVYTGNQNHSVDGLFDNITRHTVIGIMWILSAITILSCFAIYRKRLYVLASNFVLTATDTVGDGGYEIFISKLQSSYPAELLHAQFGGVLGAGQFGLVKQFRMNIPGEDEAVYAAAKSVKNVDSETQKKILKDELAILKVVGRHANVVGLLGFATFAQDLVLLLDYCPWVLTDELMFLGKYPDSMKAGPTVQSILLEYLSGVASGLSYLSMKGVIHRDISARNVLIGTDAKAKITDFGLSLTLTESCEKFIVRLPGEPLPWRWTAPEALTDGIFSMYSDVWSFGVLLFECFSFGDTPYLGIPDCQSLIRGLVDDLIILPQPVFCTKEIYSLMTLCFNRNYESRPSFAFIAGTLEFFWNKYQLR